MFCRSCKAQLDERAIACPSCGVPPLAGRKYCQQCGSETVDAAVVCTRCGVALKVSAGPGSSADKKLAAGLTAILLAGLGIHKFILGYNSEGLIMLLVSLLTCGAGWFIMAPISIIEGVIYLSKSDEEFVAIYLKGRRGWF